MKNIQLVNPKGTRVYAGTLTDNAPLHESLIEIALGLDIQFGTFELLGGLSEIEFTAYDFVSQTRLPPLTHSGAMEITGGHGTISLLDGQPHVHTHLVVVFRDENAPHGIAIVGGHVSRAICFAVEFTLTAHDGAPIHRAHHAGTGLKLWNLPALLEAE